MVLKRHRRSLCRRHCGRCAAPPLPSPAAAALPPPHAMQPAAPPFARTRPRTRGRCLQSAPHGGAACSLHSAADCKTWSQKIELVHTALNTRVRWADGAPDAAASSRALFRSSCVLPITKAAATAGGRGRRERAPRAVASAPPTALSVALGVAAAVSSFVGVAVGMAALGGGRRLSCAGSCAHRASVRVLRSPGVARAAISDQATAATSTSDTNS